MKRVFFPFLFLLLTLAIFAQTERLSQQNIPSGAGQLSVTIGGDFPVTGSFPAFINERVDQFVTRTYNRIRGEMLTGITDPDQLIKARELADRFSLRNISLIRANGEQFTLDLMNFRRTADFTNNPYLRNDDVLIFPPYDITTSFISISGAVNNPGTFGYVEGDRLTDLIDLANGLNPAYENITTAEIYRLSADGENIEQFKADIKGNTVLRRGDRVVINGAEIHRRNFSVRVIGEVNNPGTIPITKTSTTLYDVINRAGGFTDGAAIGRGRVFTGNSINLLLEKRYGVEVTDRDRVMNTDLHDLLLNFERSMMYRMSNILEIDTSYFFLENELRVLNEGSAVDFAQVSDPNSEAGRYKLRDGDVIVIPKKTNSVYVYGQVVKPGHVNFVEGADFRYYINMAGGLGEQGRDEPMVIKGNTRNWMDPKKNTITIEEGDYIWVPRDEPRSFDYYVWRFGNYIGILGGIATIVILLLSLKN